MSGARVCVTNTIADLRSCTVGGEHLSHCDGHARRYDREAGRTVITDQPCRGCLPRPAEVGHLCFDHVTKLDAALAEVTELVRFAWEDGSNGIRDTNTGGSAGGASPNWTIPESRLMAGWIAAAMTNAIDVLDRRDLDVFRTIACSDGTTRRYLVREGKTIDLTYLDEANRLPLGASARTVGHVVEQLRIRLDAGRDELISTPRGAEAAIRMTMVVQAAYAKFPLEETEHRVAGVRCPQCKEPRLVWKPPLMHRGDVVIRCDACGHRERQEWLEQYSSVLKASRALA